MPTQKELQDRIAALLEQSDQPLVLSNGDGEVMYANEAATAGRPSCLVQAHQDRMEAVGRLAGGLVHEFNNHLGGILGYASYLRSKHADDDLLQGQLGCIETAALQARDLTLRLLTFARGAHFHRAEADMGELVSQVAESFSKRIPAEVGFSVDSAPGMKLPVRMDTQLMATALRHLLENGLEAVAERGGQLRLEVCCPAIPGKVQVLVSDDGPGLPSEVRRHLFEPYYSTRPNSSRRGLGLSMVYGIVYGHDGLLSVDTPPGGGTVFRICLPLHAETSPGKEPKAVAPCHENGVLVVDDDRHVRQATATTLRSEGFTVHEASGGEEALRMLDLHSDIGLVLLDMIMPGLSGPEVFGLLRKRRPTLRFLITTAHAPREQCDHLLHSGALGLLRKPYKAQDLIRTVSEIIPKSG